MKKRAFQILIILLVTATAGIGIFLNLEEEDGGSFDVDYVQNSKLDIYCSVQFEDGYFSTDNLQDECPEVGSKHLSAELFKLQEQESQVFGLLKRKMEEVQWFLIGVDEGGIFAMRELTDEPEELAYNDGFFNLDSQETEYSLVADQFIEISNQYKDLSSPKHGFSIEIPLNWDFKKDNKHYFFFHEELQDYFLKINLENYSVDFKFPEEIGHEKELNRIEDSLEFNNFENLPDYNFFKNDLEDYIEVNTVTGEVIYREGGNSHQFSVLASGDPEGWNGTPSGLYNLISKEGLRFSTESEVYMPFSMRLYGKYLIHGEAYYPSGVPYRSAVSGGCVRVRNEEMSELYDLVEAGLPVVSITHQKTAFNLEEMTLESKPKVSAESFLVVDIDSGKILAGNDFEKPINITHLTKLMTAIVTTEQMGVTTPITARDYMLGEDNTNAEIKEDRSFRLVDLLAPLLVEHSDNAARVLSHYVGRDNTLDYVREKAHSIGMANSYFEDSLGIDKSITTAKDLYYLLYYLTNTRKPILEITKAGWVPDIDYNIFQGLKNQNVFYDQKSFSGGFFEVNEVGTHNGIFLFEESLNDTERELAFVMLGVPTEADLIEDVNSLRDWLAKTLN